MSYRWLIRPKAVLAALLSLILATSPAFAAWPGSSEQLSNGGQVGWPGPAAGMVEAWRVELSAPLVSDPVVDDQGNTVIADQVGLTAYGPDGAKLWTTPMATIRFGSVALLAGEQAAALVIAVTSSPRAIRAVSVATGEVVWSTTLIASPGSPPLVGNDGRLYLVTTDGRLRAFSHSGGALWSYSIGGVVSLPLARGANGLIYALQDNGTLTAVDPARRTAVWRCETHLTPAKGPAVAPDGALYFVTGAGSAVRVSPTGSLGWRIPLAGTAPPLTTADGGSVYLSSDGLLRLLSKHSTTVWSTDLAGKSSTIQPIADSTGIIHVAAGDTLCRLTMQGALLAPAALISGEQILSLALPAQGEAIVVTDAGTLYCLRPPTTPGQTPETPEAAWLPDLVVPDPDGLAGWYRQPLQLSADSASIAEWPAGQEVCWTATTEDATQSGVITAGAHSFVIDLQGQVSLVLRNAGGLPGGEATATLLKIDRTPPVITLQGAVGAHCIVPPGEFTPQVDCHDAGSGMAQCTTMLDGESLLGPVSLSNGSHTLAILAVDHAGNQAERTYQLDVANSCAAFSLNPILASSVPARTPAWSSWVTVLIRLPREAATPVSPETPVLAGVPGKIVARLPASASSDYRAYLARFDRSEIVAAISSRVGPAAGRLVPVPLELLVNLGPDLFAADIRILWRR